MKSDRPHTLASRTTHARLLPAAKSASRHATTALVIGAALAASALWVRHQNRQAAERHPPRGQYIEVDGVRLHYIERGQGQPMLLVHGNGSMIEDLELSGWVDLAAEHYRVIVFDRPGFGYSDRPRDKTWTPGEQAQLLRHALDRLGIAQAIVVGHSWGTLVALALALDHPAHVRSLVLLSGYYYPSVRFDVLMSRVTAVPILGDLLRHTLTPLLGRLAWPAAARRIFGPPKTPARFSAFPVWLALRPSQLRAVASEARQMIPAARQLQRRYHELQMPVAILAGSDDRITNARQQSQRLHEALAGSTLQLLPAMGHMLYYFKAPEIMAAIDATHAAADVTQPSPALTRAPQVSDRSLH